MKFFQVMGTLALAASACAQTFEIATPTSGEALTAGQSFIVEVDQPVSQGVFQSVSVVIGLQTCGSTPCPIDDNDGILGEILYAGDYSPQRHEVFKPPYQNFTFTLPNTTQSGDAVIHVTQLFLVGAGPSPQIETKNVSVTLAQAASAVSGAKFRRFDVGL